MFSEEVKGGVLPAHWSSPSWACLVGHPSIGFIPCLTCFARISEDLVCLAQIAKLRRGLLYQLRANTRPSAIVCSSARYTRPPGV